MENPFKIDIRKWVLLLLPTPLHKPVLYHFIWCMLVPYVRIYRAFFRRRMTNNFYARYDSSYGNIERMLNILFPSEEGIVIVKASENTDPVVEKLYVTTDRHTPGSAFVGEGYIDKALVQPLYDIIIPSDLQDRKDEIGDLAGQYSLPGYSYNLK